MKSLKFIGAATLGFLLLAGLSVAAKHKITNPATAAAEPTKAIAVLKPTEGNKVWGWATFTKDGDKIKVVGEIEGLTPGKHGFHVHEFGDCSAKDASSAGPHFNPQNTPHADHGSAQRHVGDLGNIEANADGKARIDLTDSAMKLDGPNSILGRGVIVHAQADDLKSQPAGNAGGRQACAAIGIAKP
ncbi:MAG TPA: superoxide dismutase family protein [Blastocatellia bacterium]|nr:superoxide dismutase family protein [Blastocatellia bacterium]HMV86973.1 superoxide dismutase family protein [Blastocatellia bacterium]HMX27882.1 superoxide dismutase family protein [Blastocatellia bacterium]HMY74705.1 superoxide dismutase family protein [Blastocatellia bacterium]HMZ17025.1 superoxide dismutase family protein [Blastocatellia bacterium]